MRCTHSKSFFPVFWTHRFGWFGASKFECRIWWDESRPESVWRTRPTPISQSHWERDSRFARGNLILHAVPLGTKWQNYHSPTLALRTHPKTRVFFWKIIAVEYYPQNFDVKFNCKHCAMQFELFWSLFTPCCLDPLPRKLNNSWMNEWKVLFS